MIKIIICNKCKKLIDYSGFVFKELNILYPENKEIYSCPDCKTKLNVYEYEYPKKIYGGVVLLSILPVIGIAIVITDNLDRIFGGNYSFFTIFGLILWIISLVFIIIFMGIVIEHYILETKKKEILGK